jgi:hypothetical protein
MAKKPVYQAIDELPQTSMTTRILHALDWVAPGHWTNTVGFENFIRQVTGETDRAFIQRVGERAIALYNDKSQGYQGALWLYQSVDTLQGVAGWLALANKVGETFSFASVLNRLTPKSEYTQGVDFCVKLVVELVAFCKLNGLPGDSTGEFVKSLTAYRDESLMRMAALVCLDGLLPLGPDFLDKALSYLDKPAALAGSERFGQVQSMIPGADAAGKLQFLKEGTGGVRGWVTSFVRDRGLDAAKVVGPIRKFLGSVEGKLDYVAAFLDVTTNYYEHTGTQSVARSLITRAAGEV